MLVNSLMYVLGSITLLSGLNKQKMKVETTNIEDLGSKEVISRTKEARNIKQLWVPKNTSPTFETKPTNGVWKNH